MVVMKTATVAEAYLELLALRGIEYFFGNAGTDFASIIDAFACRQEHGKSIPRAVHPEGWAVRTNQFPLSELPLTARYEKICEAFGGYGERVEDPEQVGPAIERALRVVTQEKRQALPNIICKHP